MGRSYATSFVANIVSFSTYRVSLKADNERTKRTIHGLADAL